MTARADARGWGPGWPNGQGSKQVKVTAGGISLWVRREISPLVIAALTDTAATGYRLDQTQCGAYVNRAIGGTSVPSNHSWGLAVDLNWRENPMTRDRNAKRTITPAVVAAWKRYGFSWGGDWTSKVDLMHFEHLGTPAQVAAQAAALRSRPPIQEDDMADPKIIDQLNRIENDGRSNREAIQRLEDRRKWVLVVDEEDKSGAVWLTDGFIRRWVQDGNHLQGLANFYGLDASKPSRWKHNDVVRIPIEPGTDLPPEAA